jgi:TetR/AcrR family transcriptional regulator, regulator of cefoperazone and chloramphenicol sensitivity
MTTAKNATLADETSGISQGMGAPDARARILSAAIDEFGRHGFDAGLRSIADAAGVSAGLVLHHFGSKEGLRKECDDYILESIRTSKSEALQSASPATWFAQLAQVESYAPMMAYLVRSMQSGGDLGRTLTRRMIANAEQYLEDGVRAGTIKPSRDPKARAKFLAMAGGGGFLLYLHMHDNPDDMVAVLRDYGKEMILPALEIYTQGLMADATMYDAFVAKQETE